MRPGSDCHGHLLADGNAPVTTRSSASSDVGFMGRSSIWVRIQFRSEGWTGRLVPGRSDQIEVHFFPDPGPLTLPLDSVVEVGFAQAGMVTAVRDEARLINVDRRREDGLICRFQLANPARLGAEVRGAVIDQRSDTRRFLRANVPTTEEIAVPVVLTDAPPSAKRLVGRLLDGSAGGVGLAFPLISEPLLCRSTTMRAEVPLPGLERTSQWVCDVRYRTLWGPDQVRYGLQFISDGVAVHPPGPQLESLWDCENCDTRGLLDGTHAFCPQCGTQAAGDRRHPSWRELATAEVHPLCGTELACGECGVAHSTLARFCGNCSARLHETPTLPSRQRRDEPR